MKPGLPISMVDTSASGMKLVTRGKVRGRALKQQQGVGINETDVKVNIRNFFYYVLQIDWDVLKYLYHATALYSFTVFSFLLFSFYHIN
jgi:hypothetical protein